ncbi:hypothetical protein MFIFM68171_06126 [Madurella fahalii]|uniref:Uncharacterized protein n=1 Tax=Madurella fahalii TaxID=1157608 RepID=A0ABQ0GDS1_9PEZI
MAAVAIFHRQHAGITPTSATSPCSPGAKRAHSDVTGADDNGGGNDNDRNGNGGNGDTSIVTTTTLPLRPDSHGRLERFLRAQARDEMTRRGAALANGSPVPVPEWYWRESRARPVAWIKDWVTGVVRPRRMVDDMVENMGWEKREGWLRRQKGWKRGRVERWLW